MQLIVKIEWDDKQNNLTVAWLRTAVDYALGRGRYHVTEYVEPQKERHEQEG